MPTSTILLLLLLLIQLSTSIQQSIDLVPKLIRRPTHLDHYLCRQLHNGIGLRAIAVTVCRKKNFCILETFLPCFSSFFSPQRI